MARTPHDVLIAIYEQDAVLLRVQIARLIAEVEALREQIGPSPAPAQPSGQTEGTPCAA